MAELRGLLREEPSALLDNFGRPSSRIRTSYRKASFPPHHRESLLESAPRKSKIIRVDLFNQSLIFPHYSIFVLPSPLQFPRAYLDFSHQDYTSHRHSFYISTLVSLDETHLFGATQQSHASLVLFHTICRMERAFVPLSIPHLFARSRIHQHPDPSIATPWNGKLRCEFCNVQDLDFLRT